MFAPGGGKSFERSLHDPLTADVNPGAGSHLPVHGQSHSFEPIELGVIVPLADKIRVRDEYARRFVVRFEFSDGFP